jgi:hypothetical protein
VEFDDQGWFVDRRQMNALLKLLDELENSSEGDPKEVLIQVYAHGWKHNASFGDNNVVCFSRFLERTDLVEKKLVSDDPRTVVGVYLGWRGLPYEAGELSNFSSWTRKDTAARLGRGGVFELLTRLNDYRSRRRQQKVARDMKKDDELIATLRDKVENATDAQEFKSAKAALKKAITTREEAQAVTSDVKLTH